jgi:hypothetical protein
LWSSLYPCFLFPGYKPYYIKELSIYFEDYVEVQACTTNTSKDTIHCIVPFVVETHRTTIIIIYKAEVEQVEQADQPEEKEDKEEIANVLNVEKKQQDIIEHDAKENNLYISGGQVFVR